MRMQHIVQIAALALLLSACGGGGGSGSTPSSGVAAPAPLPPVAAATFSVSGTATASVSTYFQPAAVKLALPVQENSGDGGSLHGTRSFASTSATPAQWDCAASYASLFAALPKDVDTDKDGIADTNITAAGVVTYHIDVKGDRSQMLNVGSAANTATMLNKDAQCMGVASLNLDRDNNGTADTDVDADGDGRPDYSIVAGSAVTVAGATVMLTNSASGEVFNAVSGSDGKFAVSGMKTGTYSMVIRAKDAKGKVIWNHTRRQVITANGDMGVFALSHHPVLLSVTVDNEPLSLGTNVNSISYSSRKLKAGDVVSIKVVAEDPNGAPISLHAFYHASANAAPLTVSGHEISYTVTEADLALNELQIGADLNNDDGVFGMDAYRDLFVSVTYKMQANEADTLPDYNGVIVNGVTYTNPAPRNMFTITTAPVEDGAPIDFTIQYDATKSGKVSAQVADFSGTTRTSLGYSTPSFVIPGSVTRGVYSVNVWVLVLSATGKGNYNNVYLPVKTAEKPAKLNGLLVNGRPYRDQLLRVGDVMTAQVQATDPLGLPLQYLFNLVGTKSQIMDGWSSNNTLTYTITEQDTAAEFAVRVFVRNNDSRTQADTQSDDSATFPIKVTM